MENSSRRYTEEEVTDIVREALDSHPDTRGTIGHDELVEIARKSGVSRDHLESAIETRESKEKLEGFKTKWLEKQKKEFTDHLKFYLFINVVLLGVTLFTNSDAWNVGWVSVWGIFVLLHAAGAYSPNDEKTEKGAMEMLNAELKEKEQRRRDKFDALMEEYE